MKNLISNPIYKLPSTVVDEMGEISNGSTLEYSGSIHSFKSIAKYLRFGLILHLAVIGYVIFDVIFNDSTPKITNHLRNDLLQLTGIALLLELDLILSLYFLILGVKFIELTRAKGYAIILFALYSGVGRFLVANTILSSLSGYNESYLLGNIIMIYATLTTAIIVSVLSILYIIAFLMINKPGLTLIKRKIMQYLVAINVIFSLFSLFILTLPFFVVVSYYLWVNPTLKNQST